LGSVLQFNALIDVVKNYALRPYFNLDFEVIQMEELYEIEIEEVSDGYTPMLLLPEMQVIPRQPH